MTEDWEKQINPPSFDFVKIHLLFKGGHGEGIKPEGFKYILKLSLYKRRPFYEKDQ